MTRLLALIGATMILAGGCASWQPPAAPGEHYFCKPDSAVRYRGKAHPKAASIRPAPAHGSCRHQ